jgi:predicted XRE-type DNA-binding protein
VRTIEQQLADQILLIMRTKNLKQKDIADARGVSRQAISRVLQGKHLLTGTCSEMLEFLGVRIKLEVIPESERISTPTRDARDTASKS